MESSFQKFLNGGLAGSLSAAIVQPFDFLKTNLQLGNGKSVLEIVRREKLGLWRGLSACVFRQLTYTSARMGVYSLLDSPSSSFGERILYGMASGAIAAVVGNPAEVVLVRMTGDQGIRNYKSVFHGLADVARERALLRGVKATIARAVILNAAQLSVYSQSKSMLAEVLPSGLPLHAASGLFSGFACTVVSLPMDNLKSKLQFMPKGQYSGMIDVFRHTVNGPGGVSALWKGFGPYFLRLGPHTILTFIFLEQLRGYFVKT